MAQAAVEDVADVPKAPVMVSKKHYDRLLVGALEAAGSLSDAGIMHAFHDNEEVSREDAIKMAENTLDGRAHSMGMMRASVAANGDCQFEAISLELFGTVEHHAHVRQAVVTYIKQHEESFAEFGEPLSLRPYVRRMSKRGEWGDEFTLKGAAECFGVVVHVLVSTEGAWRHVYKPSDGASDAQRHVFLAYTYPVHYDALVMPACSQLAA